ncbi:fumarylacetoacetate hydrolase family protein [Corynebacterium sp. AOP40-9SA-29]|uniref:fumarylacetoacetate hydrolase family protein n=1 Tax=Corynebacterium sp. AOP40-9SA-29 TaxID=3457677 RepID=UPI004034BD3F
MRIVSADIDGTRRFGRVDDEGVVHLFVTDRDPLDALDPDAPEIPTDGTVKFEELDVLEPPLPVTTVRDFITFEQHTAGSMQSMTDAGNDGEEVHAPEEWFRAPAFYFTNPYAATGSGHDVRVPPGCELFDVELEVAAVISKDGFNLSVEEAWDHIGGFTVLNDWSARDLQAEEMKVGLGAAKGKDSSMSIGPVVVTKDELEQYRDGEFYDLTMELWINDRKITTDTLAHMAWTFAELVSYASRGAQIRRGDILGSGTCGGGCLAEHWGWNGELEPAPVKVGDSVTVTVQGIGSITNNIIEPVEVHPVPRGRSVNWTRPA